MCFKVRSAILNPKFMEITSSARLGMNFLDGTLKKKEEEVEIELTEYGAHWLCPKTAEKS